MIQNSQSNGSTSRRDFLRTSGAVMGGALAVSLLDTPLVHAAGNDTLRVGLIGCGERGTGAAAQALKADKNVKLVAMGDAFIDRIEESLAALKRNKAIADKIDVPKERCFDGFDNYKRVLEAGVDVVLLCTPPHF